MRTGHTIFLTGLVGMFLLASVNSASAREEDWSEKHMQKRHEKMMKLYDELGLTEEQKAQIKTKRDVLKQEQSKLREQIKDKRSALKNALDKEGITKSEVDAIAEELSTLVGQKIKNRVNGIWATKEILSTEQFKMFLEKKEEFKKQYKGKHRMNKTDEGGGS